MSTIWIFREPRSGSTAFSDLVSFKLGKAHTFITNFDLDNYPADKTNNQVFSTHSFDVLEYMHLYNDPILIRCSRKDKVEQCLSHLCTNWVNRHLKECDQFWNIEFHDNFDYKLDILNEIQPTVFTKNQVFNYLDHCIEKDHRWNSVVSLYKTHTVFYEDMCSIGVSIPILNLDLKLQHELSTVKLPPYKERLCLNHKMVRKWVEEYYA